MSILFVLHLAKLNDGIVTEFPPHTKKNSFLMFWPLQISISKPTFLWKDQFELIFHLNLLTTNWLNFFDQITSEIGFFGLTWRVTLQFEDLKLKFFEMKCVYLLVLIKQLNLLVFERLNEKSAQTDLSKEMWV